MMVSMDDVGLTQNATRIGCSFVFHHITVMMLATGNTMASVMPMMNLQAARPAKLWVAAIQSIIAAQPKHAAASSFATGKRWISTAHGYSKTR